MLSSLKLLLQMAFRNIFSSFINVIIGLIVLGGTLFFVVGGSLLGSMDEAMSRSIIGSAAGHLHVYRTESKDSPSVFEGWQVPDLAAMPDFSQVKPVLESHPNVKMVVPLGINTAIVAFGNSLDQALEKLRNAYKAKAPRAEIESRQAQIRQIVKVIQADVAKLSAISDAKSVEPRELADLARAGSDAFWQGFDRDPLGNLEFLENRIALLLPDSDQIFLQYAGTDLEAFEQAFDRLEMVDGTRVPKGQRGLLLAKFQYEEQFKLKIARRLDLIHEAKAVKGSSIAKDDTLKDLVRQNRTQIREILLQLDPLSAAKAVKLLQAHLGSQEQDLAKLLTAFLDTKDADFDARYDFFYKSLAPMLELYRIKPGDFLTISAFTKSGYVQSVNLKVYGTFQFKGMEKSGLAGALSLMDLMSFRDLYGYVTPDKIAETKALQKAAGAREVSRENAEADLFGGGESVVQQAQATRIDDKQLLGGGERVKSADLVSRVYSKAEIEQGVALEAAIILKDPSRMKRDLKELQALSDKAGLGLTVIDWQAAAGNLGKFILVAKLILAFATAIIFVVALVIINNAVVMATLQRMREIGTLRAIGAQRGFVLALVLTETAVLALAFGTLGAALGSGIVLLLGQVGIPANNEYLYFFFSGPRLHPFLSAASLLGAFFVVLTVACASALYPALMATRVSPVRAMASED